MSRRVDWEIWMDKYEPEMDGECVKMYETHEPKDMEILKKTDAKYVWTNLDGDNGNSYMSTGFHVVNRNYYVICKNPHNYEQRDYKY